MSVAQNTKCEELNKTNRKEIPENTDVEFIGAFERKQK